MHYILIAAIHCEGNVLLEKSVRYVLYNSKPFQNEFKSFSQISFAVII